MPTGTLFGFKNPFENMWNPFKKMELPDPMNPKYVGKWDRGGRELYEQDMTAFEAHQAKLGQFQEAAMGLGEEDEYATPTMLQEGTGRPAPVPIEASPYGAPLNVGLSGGNVQPGPSTPGTFGSMKNLMARANLLEQLKRKRVF